MDPLTTFNLALSFVLLSVASFMDLVKREVEDWIWLLLASITGPLTLFRALLSSGPATRSSRSSP